MFTELEIRNFRGIKHALFRDFKGVNLFVGKNNSGKSTVLESLFWSCEVSGEQIKKHKQLILELRYPDPAENTKFDEFFYEMNEKNKIELETKGTSNAYNAHFSIVKEGQHEKAAFQIERNIPRAQVKEHAYIGRASYGGNAPSVASIKNAFLSTASPRFTLQSLVSEFDILTEHKKDSFIIEVLRKMDNRLRDLRRIGNGVFADVGFDKRLPVSSLGEGMVRLLGIIINLYRHSGGVVLIDEIEVGFHYSALDFLWKTIFESAKEFNVQVFATTHSHECLEAFVKYESTDDDRRLYRLSRRENETHVTAYKREEILASLDMDLEVR
jgi:AAA15 family ATPase/GTPase